MPPPAMGPGMMGHCSGIKIGVLLIALGLGYIVWYLANREEKELRRAGQVIGTIIISVSLFLIIHTIAMFCLLFKGHCMIK